MKEQEVKYIYEYYYSLWGTTIITYHKVEKASLNFAKTAIRYYIKDYGCVYIPLDKKYDEDWYNENHIEGFTTDYNETHPHEGGKWMYY